MNTTSVGGIPYEELGTQQQEAQIPKRICCFIDCENPATWEAWGGPDDYTEACDDHLGHLLSDAPEHKVYHIPAA